LVQLPEHGIQGAGPGASKHHAAEEEQQHAHRADGERRPLAALDARGWVGGATLPSISRRLEEGIMHEEQEQH
jgi:hypothetical protein